MSDSSYGPVSAFAGLPTAAGTGGGVAAAEREGLGIAHVTARNGRSAALGQAIQERFHVALPDGPWRSCGGDVAVAGIGPERWLLTCEHGGNAFATGLRATLERHASMVDLSDAYVVLRLTGPRLRQALAKLVPIDLHERSFKAGDVAQTVAGHMAVMLWRLEDSRGEAVFELAAGRSYAHSLHRAIRDSAAEFGFVLEPA